MRGREVERARIAAALTAAREGRSSALVVTGGPGTGRSALLDDTVASAPDDVTVLRAVGAEAERDLPHAALSALCRPLRPLLAQLRPASRAVLESALDLGASGAAPHVVGAALLDLLGLAAERSCLLVVVDDHQWVDAPSREALAFAVRRLGADRVCVLLAHRTDPALGAPADLPALPALPLGPLDDLEARRALRDLAPGVAAPVADAVVATAGGLPLVLRAVTHALSAEQLAGQEPVPDPLPVSGVPEVERVLDALPRELVHVLAVAAAEPSAAVGVVRRAGQLLGLDPALLDQAERSRLVWLADGRVVFASPLLRSVAYHRLAPSEHRALHAALAQVLEPDDVERRAWHLAQGAADRDDAVARLLVQAGQRAAARGAPAQAVGAFQRAGRLSEDPHRRATALLAAAQQAVAAGHVEQARALAAEVEGGSDDVHVRAEARIVLARMTSLVGDPTTAYHSVQQLVDDVEDRPELAARLCIEAVALAFKAATTRAVPWGLRAVQLAERSGDARLLVRAQLALAVARAVHGESAPPGGLLALVRRALDDGTPVADIAVPLTEASIGLHAVGRSDEGLALIDLVARAARTARAVGVLPQVLLARADLETSLNRYADAWSTTAEAAELAERLGQHAVRRDLAFRLAGLQAMRGDADEARALYAEVLAHGSRDFLWLRARRGLGVLELGAGRPEAAVNSLEQLDVLARTLGRPDLSFGIYEHDLTLGYLEVGRRSDAEELAERFAALVAASNHATGEAALAYVRALLAADEDADPRFARAVELARPTPFLHVRALSAWAQVLARSGRPDDAAAKVRAAREIAEAMGAPGVAAWVDRAAPAQPRERVPAPSPTGPATARTERRAAPASGPRRRRSSDVPGASPASAAPAAPAAPTVPVVPAGEPATMLCVLGRWELVVDGRALPGPDGVPGKALRILALRRQMHVEELAELLWPDTDAQSGRMRLRNVVSRVRASVGPVVERRAELVSLCAGVEVDADRVAELSRAAHAAAEAGDDDTATALAEGAVALHAGPLLPDSPYADWALVPRERARRLHVGLLDLLASTAVRRGDLEAALSLLERGIEVEPHEEERYLRAVELCLDAGRRGAAAVMLDRAREVAARLGVADDPRQAELAARLRRGSSAAAGG